MQESLKSRQPNLDTINENMARFRRNSKLDGNQVPKPLEDKVKALNDDWSQIASLTANLFAARVKPRKVVEDTVVEVAQQQPVQTEVSILEDWREGTIEASRCCYQWVKLISTNSMTTTLFPNKVTFS